MQSAINVMIKYEGVTSSSNQKISHLAGKGLSKCAHFTQNALKCLIFNEKSHLASRFWSEQSEIYHFVLENRLVTVTSWHLYNSFDDLNLAIDNTQHLSDTKTIVQAYVECLDKGHHD